MPEAGAGRRLVSNHDIIPQAPARLTPLSSLPEADSSSAGRSMDSTDAGSVNQSVLPSPCLERQPIEPPCRSTISCSARGQCRGRSRRRQPGRACPRAASAFRERATRRGASATLARRQISEEASALVGVTVPGQTERRQRKGDPPRVAGTDLHKGAATGGPAPTGAAVLFR